MCKKDLALNNLQWSISHKTKATHSTHFHLSKSVFVDCYHNMTNTSVSFHEVRQLYYFASNIL